MDNWTLALFAFMLFMIGGCIWLMFWHTEHVNEQRDWCTEMGGIPLVGDKGHFKLCLDANAVIERPETE